MFIVFSKTLLGSDLDLILNSDQSEFYWSTERPENSFVLGEQSKNNLNQAFNLSGINIDIEVPIPYRKYKNFFQGNIPWKKVMTKRHWENWVQLLIDDVSNNIQNINLDYYKIFSDISNTLDSIEQIKIDRKKLEKYLKTEKHPSIISHLRSFKPNDYDFAKKIVYDQEHTISGRLKVSSGAEILLLRKDLRDIICSRYEGGKIFYVDYVSIEPRVALMIAGKDLPEDIYSEIACNLFQSKITRDIAKIFVLSTIYGAGADAVSKDSGCDADECRLYYLPKIKEYFDVNNISKKLVAECRKNNGKIKNLFGRVLSIDDKRSYKLYNHLIQSSSVDVAMLGFRNIINNIKELKIKPVGIIHDCLILDSDPSCFDDISEIIKSGEIIEEIPAKMKIECKAV